jgi:F-type H+-transporting ATPase subunit epsilon
LELVIYLDQSEQLEIRNLFSMIHLRIITPNKVILEDDVDAITLPSAEGEITILPHHQNLFSLLIQGVLKIKKNNKEDYLAIGGGYLETNGEYANILVSRAYNQDEINEQAVKKALEEANSLLTKAKNESERKEAMILIRKSVIDLKLLKKRRRITMSQ